jgi:steroid 5-alpha reductase family enzyme
VQLTIQQFLVVVAAAALPGMALLWWKARRTETYGMVDVGWPAGVALAGLLCAAAAGGWLPRRLLVGAMVVTWGGRLALHVLVHRILGGDADKRYLRLRTAWGEKAPQRVLGFFLAQGVLVVVFALPLLPAAYHDHEGWRAWDVVAVAVWGVAVAGETLADLQLSRFRRNAANRGRTCREGLWRYSRHPNYFFEWVHWWAYVLAGIGSPLAGMALAGPVLMLLFLYRVTGIPYNEAQALLSRGEDYRRYQRETSAFFPWFPRKERP